MWNTHRLAREGVEIERGSSAGNHRDGRTDPGGPADDRRRVRMPAVVIEGRAGRLIEPPVTDEARFVPDEAAMHVCLNLALRARHVPNADFVQLAIEIYQGRSRVEAKIERLGSD